MYHRHTTYLVLDAEFHQSPGVTACGSVLNPKPCDPFLVLLMSHNCYLMALRLQCFTQRYVWLHIATRANRQAYKVLRGHGQENPIGHVDRLGEERADYIRVPCSLYS
jgi:hypothetical protein